MNSELSRLHGILNSEDLVPGFAYRRNMVLYELVCYVNCLIGCVLSNRREAMPVFIRRCREFMENKPQKDWENYYAVIRSYLTEVEQAFDVGEEL